MKGKPGVGGKKKNQQQPPPPQQQQQQPPASKAARADAAKNDVPNARHGAPLLKHSLGAPPAAAADGGLPHMWNVAATWCGLHVHDRMDLPFELLLCLYAIVHLTLQNYFIYRASILDVDFFAFTFSLAALLRRFAWKQFQDAYATLCRPEPHTPRRGHDAKRDRDDLTRVGATARGGGAASPPLTLHALQQRPGFTRLVTCAAVFAVLLVYTAYSGVVLMSRYRNLRLFVVVVPVVAYFVAYHRLLRPAPDRCLKMEWGGASPRAADEPREDYACTIPLSSQTFTSLWQSVLYTCCTTTFYVGIIPVVFATGEHLYWPANRTRALALIVFCNTFVLMATYICREHVLELVAHAHTYGCWQEVKLSAVKDLTAKDVQVWRPSATYKSGALVRFHPDLVPAPGTDASSVKVDDKLLASASVYRGLGYTNCGIPGDSVLAAAWHLFSTPCKTQTCLVVVQLVVSMMLLFTALNAVTWAAVCTMVVFNYVLLLLTMDAKQKSKADRKLQSLLGRLNPAH